MRGLALFLTVVEPLSARCRGKPLEALKHLHIHGPLGRPSPFDGKDRACQRAQGDDRNPPPGAGGGVFVPHER